MQEGYFKTCWNDIKSTPNWFGKLLLLSLVMLIPIFGPIVVYGYLYGWARDIAWDVRGPMPAHIFGNEDGKLYTRGFYILVLGVVLGIIPAIVQSLWTGITGIGTASMYDSGASSLLSMGVSGLVTTLLVIALYAAAIVFTWVGSMRIAIYDRIGPGFQFGKMWAMIRHDANGLLRIFGMTVILTVIMSVIAFLVYSIAAAVALGMLSVADLSSQSAYGSYYYSTTNSSAILAALAAAAIIMLLVLIVTLPMAVFTEAMTTRALGYWTRQFEVCQWRGQDDPMPFEIHTEQNVQNAAPVAPVAPSAPVVPQAGQQVVPQAGQPAGVELAPQAGQQATQPIVQQNDVPVQPIEAQQEASEPTAPLAAAAEEVPQSWDYPAASVQEVSGGPQASEVVEAAQEPVQVEEAAQVAEQEAPAPSEEEVSEPPEQEPVQSTEPADFSESPISSDDAPEEKPTTE